MLQTVGATVLREPLPFRLGILKRRRQDAAIAWLLLGNEVQDAGMRLKPIEASET
jgi:hypothetical protein